MSRNEYWYRLGLALGYPECCCKSFAEGRAAFTLPEDDLLLLRRQKGPSYIPCKKCMELVRSGIDTAFIVGRDRDYPHAKLCAIQDEVVKQMELEEKEVA